MLPCRHNGVSFLIQKVKYDDDFISGKSRGKYSYQNYIIFHEYWRLGSRYGAAKTE
jgi:hypothetical protein